MSTASSSLVTTASAIGPMLSSCACMPNFQCDLSWKHSHAWREAKAEGHLRHVLWGRPGVDARSLLSITLSPVPGPAACISCPLYCGGVLLHHSLTCINAQGCQLGAHWHNMAYMSRVTILLQCVRLKGPCDSRPRTSFAVVVWCELTLVGSLCRLSRSLSRSRSRSRSRWRSRSRSLSRLSARSFSLALKSMS